MFSIEFANAKIIIIYDLRFTIYDLFTFYDYDLRFLHKNLSLDNKYKLLSIFKSVF